MGSGIHAVLQKRVTHDDGTTTWIDEYVDCMQYMSSEIRSSWLPFCRDYMTCGLPDDFSMNHDPDLQSPSLHDPKDHHGAFWMGLHSQCYINLDDFFGIDIEAPRRFSIEQDGSDFVIRIESVCDADEYGVVYNYREALDAIVFMPHYSDYRLVIGFDS